MTAYVGPRDEVYGIVLDGKGHPVAKGRNSAADALKLNILPQIGPLLRHEELLDRDYVRRSMSSALAPLHFRNEIWCEPEVFDLFSHLAMETWPGLRVEHPELIDRDGKQYVSLMIRDRNFAAEVTWMGHCLQMWLCR